MRVQHGEPAADHKPREIIQPVANLRVSRASSRICVKIFLLDPAGGWLLSCRRAVSVPNVQSPPSAGLKPGASGQDLCADVLVHPTGTLHSLGPVPWAKLEPADPDHRNRVGDSGGVY